MKVDELRVLEEDELSTRMRAARRELYELRFKHAVGQLENSSQIAKARHDIARIMTVLNERELGITSIQEATAPVAEPRVKRPTAKAQFVDEEPAAVAVAVAEAAPEATATDEAPKVKRTRKTKTKEAS